jgi:thiamine biosynthesis lipoprotein
MTQMHQRMLFSAALGAALALSAPGCQPGESYLVFQGDTMGTTWTVKVIGLLSKEDAQELESGIQSALDQVDGAMSTYREDSELSRFNAHADLSPFPISDATRAVFAIALEVNQESGGAFDVTVGPLVNAWGFGPEERAEPPGADTIAALRERVGPNRLALTAQGLIKRQPDVYCDLSAVAKGFAVDRAAAAVERTGIVRYMVEVGGEVRARGVNPDGERWQLGIEKPLEGIREIAAVVPLSDMAMATSGDYRNFYELDGKRYSHTIDPRTGYPVDHFLASVTVLHQSCAWADAYATAINVLGPDEGMAFAEAHDLAVLMLVHEGEEFTERQSSAWRQEVD